jgi:mono/diheme cytochrome c family protein
MSYPKGIVLELAVAAVAVLAAGALAHAAVSGQPAPIFQAVEQQADELGKMIFLGEGNCITCHRADLTGT